MQEEQGSVETTAQTENVADLPAAEEETVPETQTQPETETETGDAAEDVAAGAEGA